MDRLDLIKKLFLSKTQFHESMENKMDFLNNTLPEEYFFSFRPISNNKYLKTDVYIVNIYCDGKFFLLYTSLDNKEVLIKGNIFKEEDFNALYEFRYKAFLDYKIIANTIENSTLGNHISAVFSKLDNFNIHNFFKVSEYIYSFKILHENSHLHIAITTEGNVTIKSEDKKEVISTNINNFEDVIYSLL